MYAPTTAETPMTTKDNLTVSFRVGQLTFFNSSIDWRMNCIGPTSFSDGLAIERSGRFILLLTKLRRDRSRGNCSTAQTGSAKLKLKTHRGRTSAMCLTCE